MFKLKVIVGSTRGGRNADAVCNWFMPIVRSSGSFDVEVLDLREWQLPFFQETIATVGDFQNPVYSEPIVKQWNDKIKEADAYIIVTPEYNHSIPGVLKNAIDSVFFSFAFRQKPVAFVSYSIGVSGGLRAVEHLSAIMIETEAVPVRTPTVIPFVTSAFDDKGQPNNPAFDRGMTVMLDDLAWLAKALKDARAQGTLIPAALRMRYGAAK